MIGLDYKNEKYYNLKNNTNKPFFATWMVYHLIIRKYKNEFKNNVVIIKE